MAAGIFIRIPRVIGGSSLKQGAAAENELMEKKKQINGNPGCLKTMTGNDPFTVMVWG